MRTLILASAAALTCLGLTACGDSSTSKTDASSAPKTDASSAAKTVANSAPKVEAKPGESSKFAADLAAVMTKSGQGPVSAETVAAVKDAVAKYSEKDAIALLGSQASAFAGEQGQRLIYQASKAAFEKFGTAQTQFIYALREARGLGAAANLEKAREILAMPATGESRDKMWLTADLMMRQPNAEGQKDKIRRLLEDAKKLGSGEAEKLLEKL
jgi:hypothetical protein